MNLSWQPGFSLARKPSKRPRARRTKASDSGDTQRCFEFVVECPADTEDSDQSLSHASTPTPPVRSQRSSPQEVLCMDRGSLPMRLSSRSDFPLWQQQDVPDRENCLTPNEDIAPTWAEDARMSSVPCLPASDSLSTCVSGEPGALPLDMIYDTTGEGTTSVRYLTDKLHEPALVIPRVPTALLDREHIVNDLSNNASSLAQHRGHSFGADADVTPLLHPGITYNNLQHRFDPVLQRYNTEFCKIPLTSEISANPFKYHGTAGAEPEFLLHAVMALAGHHVKSETTETHRHTSLRLLRERLGSVDYLSDGVAILDAITILFSLDETRSLYGSWTTHLNGAYSVLEACGGLAGVTLSSRAGAQLGILLWWDSIVALLSREDCVFPFRYCEKVNSIANTREWDFFRLCGCPTKLTNIVFQLSRLAAEKQKCSTMKFVRFDTSFLLKLEQSLETWEHEMPSMAYADEEDMQQDRDQMHCSEAWRNGLMLYIFRVFRWQPGNAIPIQVLSRARAVVDHVFACREGSMVSKQALLPLFFAGCELKDCSTRKKIVELCSSWDDRTRYHMFRDTVPLLEEVWAQQDEQGSDQIWWGQIVDAKHSSNDTSPLQTRVCFG